MKKRLINEAHRLQQLAGIAPINEIGLENEQEVNYNSKYIFSSSIAEVEKAVRKYAKAYMIQDGIEDEKEALKYAAQAAIQYLEMYLPKPLQSAKPGLQEGRTEDWEGHINGLGYGEGHPKVFDRVGDIILARYPEEGSSTYQMKVNYDDNNEPTDAKIGFIAGEGKNAKSVNFTFQFANGQVADFQSNEQDY